jgi:membrane dipeptidase
MGEMSRRELIKGSMAAGVMAWSGAKSLSADVGGSGGQSASTGAAPRTAADRLAAIHAAGRDAQKIQAASLVVDGLNATQLDEERVRLLRQGGVNCAVKGVGGINGHARMLQFLDRHSNEVARATTVKEIREVVERGKIAIVFEWQSADPLVAEPDPARALRAYQQLGLRIVGIAYNRVNVFGGGALESHIGLTRLGRKLVDAIHQNRIVLDVGGHTGEQTGFDAIEMTSGVPVICTHTNVRALNDNPRCMTDKLIEAIARTGGVIGITAFNDFMARTRKDAHIPRTPQVGIDKYLDQFDYVRKLVGVDHVAIGADNVEGLAGGIALDRDALPPEAYSEQPWFYVKGFESIAELPNVTKGLVDRGWPAADIQKVLGENWLRVYQKVWGA